MVSYITGADADRATGNSLESTEFTINHGDGAWRRLIDGNKKGQAAESLLRPGGDHQKPGIASLTEYMADYPTSPLPDSSRCGLKKSGDAELMFSLQLPIVRHLLEDIPLICW